MRAMETGRAALRAAALAVLAAAALAAPARTQTAEQDAARAMDAWLALIDAGEYAAALEAAAPSLRAAVPAATWSASLRQARSTFSGAVTARTVSHAEAVDTLPGVPRGAYVRMRFATSFSGGAAATETVVAARGDDGAWRAIGYFIAPGARTDYAAPAGAPYTAEDVSVPTPAGHALAGTLTLPKDAPGPVPAVVLITGSGLQDRDASLPPVPGYRFFRQVADTLSRRGIAVLRLDDRGWGGSGGDASAATSADFADDIRAAVHWLRARNGIDAGRIGLLGHSEGGIIAPMIAAEDTAIAAVALLAAQSWTGRRISDFQLQAYFRGQGMTDAQIDSVMPLAMQEREAAAERTPWVRFFLDYDPLPAARRVRAPVLVLQGATDQQVSAEQAEELAAAVRAGGNADVTVRILPGINHLFLLDPAGTADVAAYAALPDKTVPPQVLGPLADWFAARLGAP